MIQGRFAQTHLIGQHLHGSAMIPTGIEQIGAARDDLQALIIMRCSCGFDSFFFGSSAGDYFAHCLYSCGVGLMVVRCSTHALEVYVRMKHRSPPTIAHHFAGNWRFRKSIITRLKASFTSPATIW